MWAPRLLFFFNDTATTEIYTLSLHDALPIFYVLLGGVSIAALIAVLLAQRAFFTPAQDRKSTRLNSSHANISYAVFCLNKKIPHCGATPTVPAFPPRTRLLISRPTLSRPPLG